MKKKSIIARVGVMAAALTLATTSLMSGTLARYTTSAAGTAQAVVAKWGAKFQAGSKDLSTAETTVIKLTDTTNTTATVSYASQTSDTVDKAADGSHMLAPGMSGSVPITIDMTGAEVDTDWYVTLGVPDTGIDFPENMTFTVSGAGVTAVSKTGKELMSMESEVEVGSGTVVKKSAAGGNQKITVSLEWSWPWNTSEEMNKKDLAFINKYAAADAAGRTLQLAVTVGAEQHDATQNAGA